MATKTKAKTPAPAEAHEIKVGKTVQVDGGLLTRLTARLKKLMGAPDSVVLTVTPEEVTLSAEYNTGRLVLRDPAALLATNNRTLRVMLPFAVLSMAVQGRGQLTLELKDNQLHVKGGNRYKAALNVERAPTDTDFAPIKGKDSEPLRRMLAECSSLLQISNMIENTPVDVHFRWGEGQITGAAADAYHAVIVTAELEAKSAHQVTMPMDMAQKLAEIGGEFEIGENKVRAESEAGSAEMNQVGGNDTLIPLESIRGLLEVKPTWRATFNADDANALLNNLFAVTEWGQRIAFEIGDNSLEVNSRGRYGEVSGSIEIGEPRGTAPERLSLNVAIFHSILSKLSGIVRLSLLRDSMLRIEPVEQKDWRFVGFVSLTSEGE